MVLLFTTILYILEARYRVRPITENLIVIAFAPDLARQFASIIITLIQLVYRTGKSELRFPPQSFSRSTVVIYTIDYWKHFPLFTGIEVYVFRNVAFQNSRRIDTELSGICSLEWRSAGDNKTVEADIICLGDCTFVRLYDVRNINATKQQFVNLQVSVLIGVSVVLCIVWFRIKRQPSRAPCRKRSRSYPLRC